MMLFRNFFMPFLAVFSSVFLSAGTCDTCGKIDIGPVYLHIDVLESGKTVKEIDMPGVRVDTPFLIWKGICLKPSFMYGGKGNSQLWSLGCGVGHYTPITDKFCVTPIVGVTYTHFHTIFHIPLDETLKLHLKERFRSISPYASLEITYKFLPCLRATASYQYAWSHSDTNIKGFGTTKSNPKGGNYSLFVEYDLNERWSFNAGAAYNESLTREKHGLRGYGARLGMAWWF